MQDQPQHHRVVQYVLRAGDGAPSFRDAPGVHKRPVG